VNDKPMSMTRRYLTRLMNPRPLTPLVAKDSREALEALVEIQQREIEKLRKERDDARAEYRQLAALMS
jgi:hypothetical protein